MDFNAFKKYQADSTESTLTNTKQHMTCVIDGRWNQDVSVAKLKFLLQHGKRCSRCCLQIYDNILLVSTQILHSMS